ncbi:MAG: histidine phosphatase family protein [Candidatus Nanoarchaeia archaeon]
MKIFIVRHGETTGDIEDRYGGDYEDHLTEHGKKESEEASKDLENKNIEIIYHSPRIRARETAGIISKKLEIPLMEVKDFRERNSYGILTGMKKSHALKKYPEEVEKLKKDKKRHNVKNSEDYDLFKKRVSNALEEVTSQKHNTIVIVTHGGPISCLAREIFKLGEMKTMNDCMIMEIEKKGKEYKLVKLTRAELEK